MRCGHSSINITLHNEQEIQPQKHTDLCGLRPTHLMQRRARNSKYFLSAQEAESSRQPGAIKVFQYWICTDTDASKTSTQCSCSFLKQLGAIYTHHRKQINITLTKTLAFKLVSMDQDCKKCHIDNAIVLWKTAVYVWGLHDIEKICEMMQLDHLK